jgi:hypothetical protein
MQAGGAGGRDRRADRGTSGHDSQSQVTVIAAQRSIRRVIYERRVADGGKQWIIDGLQDFLTK